MTAAQLTLIPEPGTDPATALYSDTATAGGLVVATQIPTAAGTSTMAATIEDQSRQALESLKTALEKADSSMSSVLHVTVHLTDLTNRQAFNTIYLEHFPPPRPVRCALGVKELAFPA